MASLLLSFFKVEERSSDISAQIWKFQIALSVLLEILTEESEAVSRTHSVGLRRNPFAKHRGERHLDLPHRVVVAAAAEMTYFISKAIAQQSTSRKRNEKAIVLFIF